jgi:hypothetical protein
LQLKDFGISRLGLELTKQKRNELCQQLMPDIETYFNNHLNEKIITNYDLSLESLESMPLLVKKELLAFLLDEENKTQTVFDIPESECKLDDLRNEFIHILSGLLSVDVDKGWYSNSLTTNALIHRNVAVSRETRMYHNQTSYTHEKDTQNNLGNDLKQDVDDAKHAETFTLSYKRR